jgi:NAD(P)-dependent dehydrogenase (short-subunit alcohol dehydrogenase family)
MSTPTALVVGASRSIGLALVSELHDRGWQVVGTVRDPARRTPLHELADRSEGRVGVAALDVTEPDQLPELRERLVEQLVGPSLDLLFVSAGVTDHDETPIGQVPTEAFVEVMVTNALGPMRVLEALEDLVSPGGVVGAMTSGQGSLANNTRGGHELYRGSKAALNMFLRSWTTRRPDRPLVAMAPGWIRTGLGGEGAPYTIEENVPKVVDVLLSRRGVPGLAYLDFQGATVPW